MDLSGRSHGERKCGRERKDWEEEKKVSVKRHRFRRHPVHAYEGLMLGEEEEYGGIIQLDLRTTNIATVVSTDSTGWTLLALSGLNPPAAARAAILDAAARDQAGAATDAYLTLAKPGELGVVSREEIIYCGDVNDRWQSRIVVVEMSDDFKIALRVIASGAVFDYTIKLIGWVLDPSVTRDAMPSEELFCKFAVNQ
jgi:hypothetical protein